ncbi:unnamed protein product [Peronospora farinosa]|nr:unnamed protein product [Peronospora farinosa]
MESVSVDRDPAVIDGVNRDPAIMESVSVDRDPAIIDVCVDRDPAIKNRDPQSRKMDNKSDVENEGEFSTKSEEVKLESPTYYHESGELYAEDVDQHMAVLPEIGPSTAEVTIDDIQVGDPGVP